ncbi:DUF1501 domain-containing protein [Candidatus Pelagibacter sp. FZCC0015]|uniref:DUF1501 domain-containing protein n=1 Tax=Candidatus Pelagibacter sp. FZCC0015 TaxID=2268451 RepID=UPI0011A5363B|nr:DUF1501 domain-containing protein [Candidatus Pelagibacter sp. FZCC0015]
MKISRRDFLKGTATSLFLAGFNFPVLASTSKKKNLIVIMLRGGMDGLCAVPVIGDKRFEKIRKGILIENPMKLDADFALHPKLKGFSECWHDNSGAIVHATSIPYTARSHFEGQNLMESGGRVPYQEKTGWLGRGMKLANLKGEGLALSLPMPLLLRGVPKNDNYYPTDGRLPREETLELLKSVYADSSEEELLDMMNFIKKRKNEQMGTGASYNKRNNKNLAMKAGQLMSNPNGPRVAVFEVNGFDTHAAQGGINGTHTRCLVEMDTIIQNLKISRTTYANSIILTVTEFGRTIKKNGGNGTEHGYGTAVFLAGGLVKKSQVHTDWPGLKRKELFDGRDLNATIDARSVYASAMSTVFDLDFNRIQKEVFFGDKLQNLSDKLFKA